MDYRIAGAILNSALYLGFVAWVGTVTGHRYAADCAIAAMGVTYLSYVVQLYLPHPDGKQYPTVLANMLVGLSILLGLSAGLLLFY